MVLIAYLMKLTMKCSRRSVAKHKVRYSREQDREMVGEQEPNLVSTLVCLKYTRGRFGYLFGPTNSAFNHRGDTAPEGEHAENS